MNRFTQVLTFSLLMLASSFTLANHDNDRGRYNGQKNGHQNQQYGGHDGGGSYNQQGNRHGNKHGNGHGNKHSNKHSYKERDYRYYDHHQKRRYAKHERNRYRHRHNGRYCNVRHAPGYAYQYGGPAYYPLPPPVVLYPPRPRIYIGGTIVF